MKPPTGLNARILLTFHHILSEKKKAVIRKDARELGLIGICKVGYPGVLAVEGKDEHVAQYVRGIKVSQRPILSRPLVDDHSPNQSLRWASCTLMDNSTGLSESDLRMHNATSALASGVLIVAQMSDVGLFMRQAGLEEWWRIAMGYTKGG